MSGSTFDRHFAMNEPRRSEEPPRSPGDPAPGGQPSWSVAAVYNDLRQIARRLMAGERADHTLQPTALVHEGLFRLLQAGAVQPGSEPAEVTGLAVRAMRRVLVDHARARRRRKRAGGQQRELLDVWVDRLATRGDDPVALLEAFESLDRLEPRQAQVATLRLQGFTVPEVAALLGVSVSTVESDSRAARAYLARAAGHDTPEPQ
jgi:RNA polymerase sigma factor (TIGR02999 family)